MYILPRAASSIRIIAAARRPSSRAQARRFWPISVSTTPVPVGPGRRPAGSSPARTLAPFCANYDPDRGPGNRLKTFPRESGPGPGGACRPHGYLDLATRPLH